jgi:hypothetical protein
MHIPGLVLATAVSGVDVVSSARGRPSLWTLSHRRILCQELAWQSFNAPGLYGYGYDGYDYDGDDNSIDDRHSTFLRQSYGEVHNNADRQLFC